MKPSKIKDKKRIMKASTDKNKECLQAIGRYPSRNTADQE
jgi:hypothetical protein